MEKMEEEVKEMAVDDGLLKGSAVGTCAMAMEVGCSRSIETNGKKVICLEKMMKHLMLFWCNL
jgi:hypothetical protein